MPKVSIIVTSYLPESRKYLDLCIASIHNLHYQNYETIIVGRPDYLPSYDKCKTVSPDKGEFWNAVGLNCGAKESSGDYLFFINDDTILTKYCLDNLIAFLSKVPLIGLLMPIGNDQQGLYLADVGTNVGPWSYEYGLENALDFMNRSISPNATVLTFHEHLCLYAVLMRRSVYEEIGPFDESLSGQDDIDYSIRSKQKGYLNGVCHCSLVWHFGGVSAAITLNDEKRQNSMKTFRAKWGV